MNRRDTIIIAVLINAGLLALLFMMAINTDDEVITNHPALKDTLVNTEVVPLNTTSSISQPQPPTAVNSSKVLTDAGAADEMDNFLKDLSTNNLAQSPFVDDEEMVDLDSEIAHKIPSEKSEDASSDTRIVEVTVKRGDALEKIARSNGTTVEVIKKINNLSSSKLTIGQVLRIPVPLKQSSSSNPVAVNPTSPKSTETKAPGNSEVQYYTIKSGDNPWKIAKEHKVKYDDILKWNNMDEEKARNLKVGDKIRVK